MDITFKKTCENIKGLGSTAGNALDRAMNNMKGYAMGGVAKIRLDISDKKGNPKSPKK